VERYVRLISCAALLCAGTLPALAQDPGQPGFGDQGQFGQPGQRRPNGPGGFGGGGGQFGQGPAGPPMGMFNPMPAMPEMAKKMVSIMALRQINASGITSRDIAAALPILKNMRELEKTLETRSNQILDEEKKALLAAQPNAPFPPDSGQRMMEATMSYRQQMDKGWEAIANGIGPEKAGLLRSLVEGGGGMGQGGPPQPGGFGQGGGRGFGGGFGGGFDRQPVPPGVANGQPDQFGNASAPPAPGAFAPQPRPESGDGELAPEPQAAPPAQPNGFGGQGRGQNRFGGRPGQPGQNPGFQGQGNGFPGQGPGNFGPGMPGPGGMGMGGPRLSLADLIELLEQKQAAMRH
jgi:hypothetical protein